MGRLGDMNKNNLSPFDRDVKRKLKNDPKYAQAYHQAISEGSPSVRMALLKRMSGESPKSLRVRKKS